MDDLDFLAGQHQALLAAVSALIRVSDVPRAVQEIQVSLSKAQEAARLGRATKAFQQGLQEQSQVLGLLCEAALKHRDTNGR